MEPMNPHGLPYGLPHGPLQGPLVPGGHVGQTMVDRDVLLSTDVLISVSTARCRPTRMCPMSSCWGPCSGTGAVISGWASELWRPLHSSADPLFFISSVRGGQQDMQPPHMFCAFMRGEERKGMDGGGKRGADGTQYYSQPQICEVIVSMFRFYYV